MIDLKFLEIKYLSKLVKMSSSYNRCLEENVRFRKFIIEYFNILQTDKEKDRYILLLEEFCALTWEKYDEKEI